MLSIYGSLAMSSPASIYFLGFWSYFTQLKKTVKRSFSTKCWLLNIWVMWRFESENDFVTRSVSSCYSKTEKGDYLYNGARKWNLWGFQLFNLQLCSHRSGTPHLSIYVRIYVYFKIFFLNGDSVMESKNTALLSLFSSITRHITSIGWAANKYFNF